MFKKLLISLCSLLLSFNLFAQFSFSVKPKPEYETYSWTDSAKLHSLTVEEMKHGSIVIKEKCILEYYFVDKDTLALFTTRHFIVRVNSDKAIAENNTVYIPNGNGIQIIDMKARAITKEGKVTMLNPNNVKDVPNYDNLGPFRIFAIDGVEQGGEVEYMYTIRQPVNILGTEYIRRAALYKEADIDIYSPSHLIFLAKSYNGFPDMVLDSTLTTKRHIYVRAKNVEGYDLGEEFSGGDGALMRLEYTIGYNKGANDPDKRLYDYGDFCQWLYTSIDKSTDKADLKIASKVIDTLKLDKLSDEDKIRRIESRIKAGVQVREDVGTDDMMPLADIFKSRACNGRSIIKLYELLFNAANIKHEIVMTSDRFDKPFDGDFESRTYLQNCLFYFPGTNNYLAPSDPSSRYGFPPSDWICQKGYFMHAITIGKDVHTGVGSVSDISCNDWKNSKGEIYTDVKFDFDQGVVNLHYKQTFSGYEAYSIQPYYKYLGDHDKKDVTDKIFQSSFPDAKPSNEKVSGTEENDIFRNPFVVEADFSTNSVLEQAGNKYLFKLGELIGPQSQLYHDTVRHTPIENHYNHGYHREISFEVPDGYKVTNLDAVNMEVADSTGTQPHTMEFHSYYKMDGNKVTVYCDEYYSQLRYPISMYEQFRNVINASADFNKVTIFLEKK